MTVCPVCGKADGACGDQALAFPPLDLTKELAVAVTKNAPIRLPKQSDGSGRHGISGYRGNVEVYDPKTESPRPATVVRLGPDDALPDDLEDLKKDDLVALAEARGVDATGTKAEIIDRLKD